MDATPEALERLGIQAGDRMVRIEDEVVAGSGFRNSDVMDRLRGRKGTKVQVGISAGAHGPSGFHHHPGQRSHPQRGSQLHGLPRIGYP